MYHDCSSFYKTISCRLLYGNKRKDDYALYKENMFQCDQYYMKINGIPVKDSG